MGDEEAAEKGDALMMEYLQNTIEYIEYYLQFEGYKAQLVDGELNDRLDELEEAYYLASYARRYDIVREVNEYYRSLGVGEENLLKVPDEAEPIDQ